MPSDSPTNELHTIPHKDIDGMLRSLERTKKDLPDFQLVIQALDHIERPLTNNSLKDVFVISSAEALPKASHVIKEANQLRKLRVLFVHLDVDAKFIPQFFARANLHMSKNILAISNSDKLTPARVMRAWAWDSQHDLIATAQVSNHGTIIVTSCALETYVVNLSDFAAFNGISDKKKTEFKIDEGGSFIYWPKLDIHLNLESFRYVCDKEFREKLDTERLVHNQKLGKAIAKIRKQAGLTQATVVGVSERTIRDIENGSRPTVTTLKKLATAHQLSIDEYLNIIAKEIDT